MTTKSKIREAYQYAGDMLRRARSITLVTLDPALQPGGDQARRERLAEGLREQIAVLNDEALHGITGAFDELSELRDEIYHQIGPSSDRAFWSEGDIQLLAIAVAKWATKLCREMVNDADTLQATIEASPYSAEIEKAIRERAYLEESTLLARAAADAGSQPKPVKRKKNWLPEALLRVAEDPSKGDAEIAREVGVNPGTLSRSVDYQEGRRRAEQAAAAGANIKKAAITNGTVDGIDED